MDIREKFTKNAEEFDALMVEMLSINEELAEALDDAINILIDAGVSGKHWRHLEATLTKAKGED